MNRKKRNLKYIRFKNKVSKIAGVRVAVKRDFTFQGVIGKTKLGGTVYQDKTTIIFYEPQAITIPLPNFENLYGYYGEGFIKVGKMPYPEWVKDYE